MLKGHNYIGSAEVISSGEFLRSYNPVTGKYMPERFYKATPDDIGKAAHLAAAAFVIYRNVAPEDRARFLEAIGGELLALGDALIQRAHLETGLPETRLTGERDRTVGQLKLFAGLIREGSWVEAVIDEAMPERQPAPRPDLRKMLLPIGPVAVFGASNFPLAFSTAGGDTASALAAGNTVIVKAHPGHLGTNEMVASAIISAAQRTGMPDGVFSMIIGDRPDQSLALATHEAIRAVGFTGSYKAGMNIFHAAINQRKEPIPVYAEMGSVNPVLILPQSLRQDAEKIATQLATSITLGSGQFCTNPGLLLVMDGPATQDFIDLLGRKLAVVPASVMLSDGIYRTYVENNRKLIHHEQVEVLVSGADYTAGNKAAATLLKVDAPHFVADEALQEEVFGPLSLVVICKDAEEMERALTCCPGQLTGTVMATTDDMREFRSCICLLQDKVGRLIFNGVPTGVEVCHAMVHGGPFPATTFSHFTSVGADAIKRFTRPVCFQDWPQEMLPDELKDGNQRHIMRKVSGVNISGKV